MGRVEVACIAVYSTSPLIQAASLRVRAGFCLAALFKLERAMRGATSRMSASIWFILASLSLIVLDITAFATRFGG